MPKKHRIILSFIVLLCFFTSTGCGYKDIDKRYFVVNLGIDHHEGKKPYTLSIKIAIPTQEGEEPASSDQATVLSINTTSLSEGLELLKTRLDRKLDFGHLKILLVDPYVAAHEMKTITAWLIERRDIQKIAYVAIADPSSKKILSFTPITEKMPSGTLILQFGDTGYSSPYTNTEYLFNFFRDLNEKGKTAVLPIIEIKNGRFQIQTVGLFDQTHLVAKLSPQETLLLNSFLNHRFSYELKVPTNKKQGVASFRVVRTKLHLHTERERPYLSVQIKAIGEIGLPGKTSTLENTQSDAAAVNKFLKKKYTHLFKAMQRMRTDPAGLGLMYRSHHFNHQNEDERWAAIYPNLTFKVHVQTDFKENGISG
ncbi:Ger(x)C family spore germination protein [Pullulanibacillus sp. KACC 23026]|uniref:Ger(x)C family spore germination protein n=1 Tax=Pullulanibacillus sp. KACC 23026 TaxID=3028315 RepID=UPI0023B0F157|nr:Ger(x)C family spore germination protein [Pullulanibacillus sp. KACC 23026]WEG12557.1 Ger(x)C family spore germination protein [Pullulanibacillus sp. KACC 23026]